MSSVARNQIKQSNFLINNQSEQLSFFEHSYKSYAPFSRVTKSISFDSSFDFGNLVKKDLSLEQEYGDLITNIVVQIKVPDISSVTTTTGKNIGYTNAIGHAIFEYMELRFDGELIDRHTSEWIDIWSELTVRPGVQENYDYLVKKFDNNVFENFQSGIIYIPLQFWFCQNSSSNNTKKNMILPLVTLRDTKIELIFKVRDFNKVIVDSTFSGSSPTNPSSIIEAKLFIDYIILDDNEKKKLQEPNIDRYYLITQVQELTTSLSGNTKRSKVDLKQFKYLVTEILWVVISKESRDVNLYFDYGNNFSSCNIDPILTTKIKFQGLDRIEELDSEYFNKVEPFMIHDNTPFSFIHCYSFALSPEDFSQPSGICNFSEIHNSELEFKFIDDLSESELKIFGINYNVLKVKNGKGTVMNKLSKSINKNIPAPSCN